MNSKAKKGKQPQERPELFQSSIEETIDPQCEYEELNSELSDENEKRKITKEFIEEYEKELANDGVVVTNAVKTYLREIGRYPLLTKEEEFSLAEEMTKGNNTKARNKLIESNLRLVVSIAKRYSNSQVPFLDLIQEGNLGLMKAAGKFDYTKGTRFTTYATCWIKYNIQKALTQQSSLIQVPSHMTNTIMKVKNTQTEIKNRSGQQPTISELAKELDMTSARVTNILSIAGPTISLETPIKNSETNEAFLYDMISDTESSNPEDRLIQESLRKELEKVLSELTEEERVIVTLHYGLDGTRPRELEEIAKMCNISREAIRQTEYKALRKMRSPYRCKNIELLR